MWARLNELRQLDNQRISPLVGGEPVVFSLVAYQGAPPPLSAGGLNTQLLHVAMTTCRDRVDQRSSERGTDVAQDADRGEEGFGIGLFERVRPCFARGVELDRPGHARCRSPVLGRRGRHDPPDAPGYRDSRR